MMLLWLVLLFVLIYLIYRYAEKSPGGFSIPHRGSALDILKRRYANGEITRDQYLEMKRDLEM